MNRTYLACWGFSFALTAGCAYRGAVYSQYTQLALDLRASSNDAGAPLKVNLGYDRGEMAYVPKLDADGDRGEAVSLISWDNAETMWTPIGTNTSSAGLTKVLQVDAGFISGVAANVAAAPHDAKVVIKADGASTNLVLRPTGTPGERINAAMPAISYGVDDNTPTIRNWLNSNPSNPPKLNSWLGTNGLGGTSVTAILRGGQFRQTRSNIVEKLISHP